MPLLLLAQGGSDSAMKNKKEEHNLKQVRNVNDRTKMCAFNLAMKHSKNNSVCCMKTKKLCVLSLLNSAKKENHLNLVLACGLAATQTHTC